MIMIRTTLAALVLAAAGCSASLEPLGMDQNGQASQEAQLAAFAAAEQNQFPRDAQASDDFHAAAVVDRDKQSIRIFNYTNEPISNAKLWVNQSYVRQIDTLPANGSTRVSFSELYNNNAQTFIAARAPITSIQLQTGDRLHNVLGPAYE
jgi:hypothetical protein